MARRGRSSGSGPAKGRPRDPESYYVTSESDRRYVDRARERVKRGERRRLWIRLLILAVLALLGWEFGPYVVQAVRGRAETTAHELKQVGDGIRGGAARRAGAELGEDSP